MKIEMRQVSVRDVVNNFKDKGVEGVTGLDGKLDIRPAYQREFVYKEDKKQLVISTILKSFPLNTMYWVSTDEGFEVLDGQQRTLSICEFVKGLFPINHLDHSLYFDNLATETQEKILDYKLMVLVCEGSEEDKLEWFRTINIAGQMI